MEAEHAALEHDYNLLKSGVQSDSSGINEIYELEIRVSQPYNSSTLKFPSFFRSLSPQYYSLCGQSSLLVNKTFNAHEHVYTSNRDKRRTIELHILIVFQMYVITCAPS